MYIQPCRIYLPPIQARRCSHTQLVEVLWICKLQATPFCVCRFRISRSFGALRLVDVEFWFSEEKIVVGDRDSTRESAVGVYLLRKFEAYF